MFVTILNRFSQTFLRIRRPQKHNADTFLWLWLTKLNLWNSQPDVGSRVWQRIFDTRTTTNTPSKLCASRDKLVC